MKDIIIRGGHNIDPALIEEPAHQHPAVQLAAAVDAGELPILNEQLKPYTSASAEALEKLIRERIAERAGMPKSIIVLPELLLSGPGKISKLLLLRSAIDGVFGEELARLALAEIEIRATVVEDSLSGEIVTLSCLSDKRPDTRDFQRI